MTDADLLFTPVRALAAQLRSRSVTAVRLAEASLARLESLGGRYNAVVTVMRESALAQARAADAAIAAGRARSPLAGIPFGVKDLLATRDAPTTWGAEPYRDQRFDHDATVVRRLLDAGAVLVAKLSMVELAGGLGYDHADASFTGPGLTPWNVAFWSGGSSSGPGAAVAAGLVSFAIGSETSGSILTPSAFCGVTGLRPTYGLVSRHGAMALSWTLDKLGPMARCADDAGLVLAAIAGADPLDDTATGRTFDWSGPRPPVGAWRIGVPKGCVEQVQPAVRERFEASLAALGEHVQVTRDVAWPDLPWGAAVGTIVGVEGASAFRHLIESGDAARLRCAADRVGGYASLMTPAVDYLAAMRARRPMRAAMADLYSRYDVIATPTRATVAYPADKGFADVYPGINGGPPVIAAGNLTGLPALALPNGFGDDGLPTSIAFMGAPFSERTLLEIGCALQSGSDAHLKRPPGTD